MRLDITIKAYPTSFMETMGKYPIIRVGTPEISDAEQIIKHACELAIGKLELFKKEP